MKMDLNRQERVGRYVRERRCREGGYCFYRLEEPNSADTYWALAILHRLGAPVADADTVRYLQSFQKPGGGFENFQVAHFVLKGLRLLAAAPLQSPLPYLTEQLRIYDVALVPAGEASIFKHMYLVLDLCVSFGIVLKPDRREEIRAFILRQQAPDGGFGREYGTLIETAQALTILRWLQNPHDGQPTTAFIARCENGQFGFVNVPRTMPGYIEHVYWGLLARLLAGGRPAYLATCREVVLASQNLTGGFSRTTYGGIANLENTWYAVEALAHLKAWPVSSG